MIIEIEEDEIESVCLAIYGEIDRLERELKADPGLGLRMKRRIAVVKSFLERIKSNVNI